VYTAKVQQTLEYPLTFRICWTIIKAQQKNVDDFGNKKNGSLKVVFSKSDFKYYMYQTVILYNRFRKLQ